MSLLAAHTNEPREASKVSGTTAYFSLWKDADPDIPILKEAKAEYANLK